MQRKAHELDGAFDLLVVGGGVYGAWCACDAARRGLSVALVERGDWASGTSSASSKLLHGGLRYLEQFAFSLVRKSLHERKVLAHVAPHHVRPLRFVLPIYRHSRVGWLRLKAGLTLYDWLAGYGQPVGRHEALWLADLKQRCDWLDASELIGGFTYGDCQMDDARFALDIVRAAGGAGAVTVNYAEAIAWMREGDRLAGAVVRDRATGAAHEVRSRVVVQATGPWGAQPIGAGGAKLPMRLTKGVHLVMPRLSDDAALLTARSDGRVFFLIPWYGRTLLGTTDTDYTGDPGGATVDDADVDYLLGNANAALAIDWTRDDVHGSFAGLRSLVDEEGKDPSAVSREWRIERPHANVLASVGGKWTSARADAAVIVDEVQRLLDQPVTSPPPTETTPLPTAPSALRDGDFEIEIKQAALAGTHLGVDLEAAEWLARRHGREIAKVHDLVRADASLAARIVDDLPFIRAEVVHAARHEMALTLEDVIRRRVPLSILARLSDAAQADITSLAQANGVRTQSL